MSRQLLLAILGPILGLLIISLGNGFISSLTSLRLDAAGVPVTLTGLVSSAYFIGLALGAIFSDRLITRTGHIRAYGSFASLIAVTILLQGLIFDPWMWFTLRFLCGWASVGVYLVIESWLLMSADKENRGRLLALYMVALYGSGAGGQAALGYIDALGVTQPFMIAGILAALSVLPVVMIPRVSPLIEPVEPASARKLLRSSPSGVAGCLGSGVAIAAVYTLLPLWLQHQGLSIDYVGYMMSSVILGAMLLQYPVGRWSDRTSRQVVMIALCAFCALLSLAILLLSGSTVALAVALFLLGGGIFSLYPVAVSHSADFAPPDTMVKLIQGMLLVNSVGAAISPLSIAPVMTAAGTGALFWVLAALHLALMLFFIWRRNESPAPVPVAPFEPLTQMTPLGAELRVSEEMMTQNVEEQTEAEPVTQAQG